ncbi:MAG: hypothetical protein Q9198_003326 [Flavoplaca austrocitrina]
MESGGRSRAINFRPLFELVCSHLNKLSRAIIIIDAADECSDFDKLLPGLILLTEKGTAKVILTSRREPNLINILQDKPGLGMELEDVQEDIRHYLEYQVDQSQVLSHARVRHRITRILNIRSKGMFLWVVLMIKELEVCLTVEEIEDTLNSLPDGLNGVYERILTRLHDSLKPLRKNFCCRLLKWITLAKRPLRLTEVGEALRIQYAVAIDDFGNTQHLLCSTRELELVCGSLVTVKDGVIQLIHLSTKEFLIDQKRASDLSQDIHAFFVRTQDDSALLSGICVMYLSTCCVPGTLARDDSPKGWQMDEAKLLEYAYLNWLLHLTESSSQALLRQEPTLQRFLASRNSLYWLEICFTVDRETHSTLSTHLQAVLNWCLPYTPEDSGSRSPQGLVPLLHYWAKSYLQLLDDYGPSLKNWPHEVHYIDPERIFEPSGFQILESLRQNGSYHRHLVLKDSKPRRFSMIGSAHKALQKYTGLTDHYGCFLVDERRQVFFTLDKEVYTAPRIYCQEISTGKRLSPIIDTEFGENNCLLRSEGATLSACGQYLGIVYSWRELGGMTIYTAIWHLSEHFDFSGAGHVQWARKINSLSTRAPGKLAMFSTNPVAFDDDGFVYCPHGRVDLTSGVQKQISRERKSEGLLDVTFSRDGQSAVLASAGDYPVGGCIVEDISPGGELTVMSYPKVKETITFSRALSSSRRFIIWSRHCCLVHDRFSQRTQELDRAPVSGNVRFLISKDEKILLGVNDTNDSLDREITRIIIWRQSDSLFDFWAEKAVRGLLRGFCLDERHNLLYMVSPGRIWSRVDISTTGLIDPDFNSDEPQISRTEYEVSRDSTRMIILRRRIEK